MTGDVNPAIPAAMAVLEAINTGNLDLIDDAVTSTFVDHEAPASTPPGPAAYRRALAYVTQVLQVTYELEEIFATDDRIAIRATAHGRGVEHIHGPGTDGRPFSMRTLDVFATAGDRLAEHWGLGDEFGVRRRLAAGPTMRRLFTDELGAVRLEAWRPTLSPEMRGPGESSASDPLSAVACMVVRASAGAGPSTLPGSGRRLLVVLSGECEVTSSGESVVGRPGDLLLVDDMAGLDHSSRTATGFDVLMIVLD